jgi:hypothetical protein
MFMNRGGIFLPIPLFFIPLQKNIISTSHIAAVLPPFDSFQGLHTVPRPSRVYDNTKEEEIALGGGGTSELSFG